jgi:integrase
MRESNGRVRWLNDDERSRLLAECQASRSKHLYPLVILALSTGARHGELLGLRWADVDLDRGVLTFHATKNGSRRSVPLAGRALELLKALPQSYDLVFPGNTADQRANIQQCWKLAVKRAGLQDVVFHTLRHTAASYLAMQGVSLLEIGKLLGHKTPSMTFRYTHLSTDHLAGLASRLDATLFG